MYYVYFIRAEWNIFLDQDQIKKKHLKSTFSSCSWTLSKSLKRLLKLYETLPLETFWRIWLHILYICLYTYALTYTSTYINMLKVPQVIASISSYLWIAGEETNI